MKRLLLFSFFLLGSLFIQAQPPMEWARNFDLGNTEWYSDMVIDDLGNQYTTGSVEDTATNSILAAVFKRDTNGDSVWNYVFDTLQQSWISKVILDHSGNVIIAGYGYVTMGYCGIIVKLDNNGNELWHRFLTTHAPDSYDCLFDVKCDNANNIYVAGTGGVSLQLTVAKYNPSGALLWSSVSPVTSPHAYYTVFSGFDIDASGNAYLAGILTNDTVSTYYDNDYMLLKFDPAGNLAWEQKDTVAGEAYYSEMMKQSVICDGNDIYVMQPHPGYIPFCTTTPSTKIVLLKYNSSGAQNFHQEYLYPAAAYNYPRTMKMGDNGLYLSGTTYKDAALDYDYLILKTDLSGNLQWMRKKDFSAHMENLYDIDLDASGTVYVAGASWELIGSGYVGYTVMVAYDHSGTLLWSSPYNQGISSNYGTNICVDPDQGIFIGGQENANLMNIKYSFPLGISENQVDAAENILLSPNPCNGHFTVQTRDQSEIGEFILYDISGKEVLRKNASSFFLQVDISNLENGCYFYDMKIAGDKMVRGKILNIQ